MENYSIYIFEKAQYFKMSVLTNLTYIVNKIPIKIPASYCVNIKKLILMFILND